MLQVVSSNAMSRIGVSCFFMILSVYNTANIGVACK